MYAPFFTFFKLILKMKLLKKSIKKNEGQTILGHCSQTPPTHFVSNKEIRESYKSPLKVAFSRKGFQNCCFSYFLSTFSHYLEEK